MRPLFNVYIENIIQARIPLPFPLRWVNAYIVKEKHSRYTIIDPGIHTEAAKEAWHQILAENRIQMEQIDTIVLTHHHPDHFGLCGWLQTQSGAEVYMTQPGWQQAKQLWTEGTPASDKLLRLFREHGMPISLLEEMETHLRGFIPMVTPFPENVRFIELGGIFNLAGRKWRVVHAPGHAFGHVMFYEPSKQLLFCGDHVLPKISPNISFIPDHDDDPLHSYLCSLAELRNWPVQLAFPGHRDPFANFGERVSALLEHHDIRLQQMRQILQKPMSTYELCRKLFGDHLTTHQLRFAMAETIAHVRYMENRRLVSRDVNTLFYSSLL